MNQNKIPRPEYPRPQFARKDWINLNGEWQFERDRAVSGRERKLWKAESFADRITVPFCMESELSGIGDKDFCDCVWYRRTVEIPAEKLADGGRAILNIGASDYETTVYVNGTRVARHIGGYTPFSADITSAAVTGENVIVLEVRDFLRDSTQPSGKQSNRYGSYGCFYTRTTGIWQTVWMEFVPKDYIREVTYAGDIQTSTLSVSAKVEGKDGQKLTAKAYWNGKPVGEGEGFSLFGNCRLTLQLSELHLWELGKGGLYDLTLCYGNDEVKSYFGMRSLSLDDTALVINGKKVFQRTVLDQGFYPDGIYTAATEDELIADITRSMACGFNGARLHQKVFEPLFLYHCDRLGYMVWDELGNWGLDTGREEAWRAYISEWSEVVVRDRNHPSVIGWCPFNETSTVPGEHNPEMYRCVADLTRRLDSTRPVIDTSGWVHAEGATDIMDWHDYDQNPESFRQRYIDVANGVPVASPKRPQRAPFPIFPRFISEYGGIKWDVNSGLGNAWGYGDAPKTEEEFLRRFKGLAEALLFNPYITGLCYTQLTDVEQETNGLYTYDRQPKFDVSFFKEVLTQKAAMEE